MSAPRLFDHALQRRRRVRAHALGAETFLIDRVAEDLSDRLAVVLRQFGCAADIGTPSPAVRQAICGRVGTLIAMDDIAAHLADHAGPKVVADIEALPFGEATLDLAVSALALQSADDLPGALVQIRRALKPDGLFVAALLGGDTLTELRQSFAAAETEIDNGVSPRVAPFADIRDMGTLLQRAGFALPVVDTDRIVVRYGSPFSLMRDLRRMGATNPLMARRRAALRRSVLVRMAEIYAARFSDADGKIRATFEILWLSGWAPHASQQQPLKPGSAKSRLADALGTGEIKLGDKAR